MSLSSLFALADSRLPIGGHVHSGGMEEAVTAGIVRDVATVDAFLRRRIRTTGLVSASIAAAVCAGVLDSRGADAETDARTPSPAARQASRVQGRGLLRLAKQIWPEQDWDSIGHRPHLPVVLGVAGKVTGATPVDVAGVLVYTTMTGSATAAQRLLALDPGDVARATFRLSELCDRTAEEATKGLAGLSDPLLDALAERHLQRERPLFAS